MRLAETGPLRTRWRGRNGVAGGLRHFALISTPETLADGSAASFYGQLTAFQGQVFDNMADARYWLRQYCR